MNSTNPGRGSRGPDVSQLQQRLNELGGALDVDGRFGPLTEAAVMGFQRKHGLASTGIVDDKTWVALGLKGNDSSTSKTPPPWYVYARKFLGKKESDPDFNKWMSSKWPLLGLDLKTIAKSYAAWCGLAMAVALSGVGLDYQHNGALARKWSSFGTEINWRVDGIPQGAVVQINHNLVCRDGSSGNHVSQANGDCSAADLMKPGATITLYGGNQGNSWKESDFSVKEICAVRWPKDVADYPKPPPVVTSKNCSTKNTGDSTQ